MSQLRQLLFLLFLCSAAVCAQQTSEGRCPLSSFHAGQTVTIRGKVASGAHDMLFLVPGCSEAVVLVYASRTNEDVAGDKIHPDENLKRFQKYTSAVYKGTGKQHCMSCSMYAVEATVTGELDIASVPQGMRRDELGFLRDASGKVVGQAGFGHPAPIYSYQLVIQSVSDVVARKLPRPE